MRCARERMRRVPLGAVRQVPGPQGGGEDGGVRVGKQEAALVSSLSSLANGDRGRPAPSRLCQRVPPLISSLPIRKTSNKMTPLMFILWPMGIPPPPASNLRIVLVDF